MIRKKSLRMALTVMALAVGLPAISHADVDDDLDELRGTNSFSDWQLVKHDTRRNIKAYTKREDGKGVRSFKLNYQWMRTIKLGAGYERTDKSSTSATSAYKRDIWSIYLNAAI